MSFNFSFYLTLIVLISGIFTVIDHYYASRHLNHSWKKWRWLFDYSRSFFPVLLVVWLLRSFVIQPYRVPTGSLEPTVKPGDFIVVSQFNYGLYFPILHTKLLSVHEPKRGDIALFHWPVDPHLVFVKRVVGVPGDHLVYHHKQLIINGHPASQHFIRKTTDFGDAPGDERLVHEIQEDLLGVVHRIFIQPMGGEMQEFNIVVPPHYYFMMGDNRDDSDDSRSWGFVPEENFIGRAFWVWFSWDPVHHRVRWPRIGDALQ